MICVVTFDAADTLIKHEWDAAGLLIRSSRAMNLNVTDDVRGREAYSVVHTRLRPALEEVEKRRDAVEIKAFWQRFAAEWLDEVGLPQHHAKELHRVCEAAVFAPGECWALYDDVLPTLEEMRSRGMKLGVISNWDSSLHRILELLGVERQFDFVVASLEYGVEKPEPGIFRIAEQIGGFEPKAALHVGDSFDDDFLGAQSAGWRSVWLRRGVQTDPGRGEIDDLRQLKELEALCC